MTSGSFERHIETTRPADACWAILTDVDRMAGWVGIVGQVKTLSPLEAYEATLEDRLGPFRLRADLDVRVTESEPPRKIRFVATGEDRHVGSRLSVTAGMHVESDARKTVVRIDGTYSVEGRVATLGAPMIRRKADAILEEFTSSAQRELA
jgi:carbon monoxide dehydrogenase subunit G